MKATTLAWAAKFGAGCLATPMMPTAKTPGTPLVSASVVTPAAVTADVVDQPVNDTEPEG